MKKINELKSKEKIHLDIWGYLPLSCMLLSVFSTAIRTEDGQTAYANCGSVGFGSAGSQREFVQPSLAIVVAGEVYVVWRLGSLQCL
jgi:hypothetical protein